MTREERLAREREVRRLVDGYERQLTDQQLHEVQSLTTEHQKFHDREHAFYDEAIAKAASALAQDLNVVKIDLARLRDQSAGYMSVAGFDREHEALVAKIEVALANESDKRGVDHEQLQRLLAQVGTLRGLLFFLGVPGIAAMLWILLAVFSGHTDGALVP